jgi:hypothetical protein
MCGAFSDRAFSARQKASFARQDALTRSTRPADPRLKAVGYGSYAGFADGYTREVINGDL